jgi:hypothetical protein
MVHDYTTIFMHDNTTKFNHDNTTTYTVPKAMADFIVNNEM